MGWCGSVFTQGVSTVGASFQGINISPTQYLTIDADNRDRIPGNLVTLTYVGAFKGPGTSITWTNVNGHIGYNPDNDSLFLNGDDVGEISIPTIVNDADHTNLNRGTELQAQVDVLSKVSNPEGLTSTLGFQYIAGTPPELLITAVDFFDSPANNRDSLIILRDADDLASGTYEGIYHLGSGLNIGEGAARTAAWYSPIPPGLQGELGGNLIGGAGNTLSIVGRWPVGHSLYVWTYSHGDTIAGDISVSAKMDFDLTNPIVSGWDNTDPCCTNPDDEATLPFTNPPPRMFSWISRAFWGGIIPGTRTYAVFGMSGGHNSSICYKCKPCTDETCTAHKDAYTGYAATNDEDNYEYYWLYSLDEILAADEIYNITPYEYGTWDALQYDPGADPDTDGIRGAAIDEANGRLIITLVNGPPVGLEEEPIFLVFDLP